MNSDNSSTSSNGKLMALQFASGSLAACGAVTVTNPFDMLKTRRQLHNELGQGKAGGFVGRIGIGAVWTAEGIRGLQKGLAPAYIYQILMNGTRFMVYEPTRHMFVKYFDTNSILLCNAVAGAIAGGIAAVVGTPFNLIKTRLQSNSSTFITGYQHGYSGIVEAIKSISKNDGIKGFYRGVGASVGRTMAGSAAQLASYDWLKPKFVKFTGLGEGSFWIHFISAMGSGVLACLVMNPFDVIMTRLYNQKGINLYNGLLDCMTKTIKVEGLGALWKGLVPHFIRTGPHTVLTLVLLEQFRSTLRPLFFS